MADEFADLRARLRSDPAAFAQHVLGDWADEMRDDARVVVIAGNYHEFRDWRDEVCGGDRAARASFCYVVNPDRLRGLSARNVSRVVFVGSYHRSPVFRSPELAHLRADIRRRDGVPTCDVCGAAMTERAPAPRDPDEFCVVGRPLTADPPHDNSVPSCPVCARAPWLPHVSTIEVRRERPERYEVTTFNDPRPTYIEGPTPRPHRPLVTTIELDAQMPARFRDDFGARNVRATANCGNRTELWEFRDTPRVAWTLRRETGEYGEPFGQLGDVMTRVVVEMGQALDAFRAGMERVGEMLRVAGDSLCITLDSPLRAVAEACGRAAEDVRADAERRRVFGAMRDSVRHLPRVTLDDATLETPAQYAAFVEFGRSGNLPMQPFYVAGVDAASQGCDRGFETCVETRRARAMGDFRRAVDESRFTLGQMQEVVDDLHRAATQFYFDDGFVDFSPGRQHDTDAHKRAEQTLLRYLDERQREMYVKTRSFLVRSQHNRIYRVGYGKQFNVVEMREKNRSVGERVVLRPLTQFCAAPADCHSLPTPDVMLAQMLMLQTDESAFRKIANKSPVRGLYNPGLDYESDVPLDEWPPRRS